MWTPEKWANFVNQRTMDNAAASARIRQADRREGVVLQVLRWLTAFFNEAPDLAGRFPTDAARRRLAEAVANLILNGA